MTLRARRTATVLTTAAVTVGALAGCSIVNSVTGDDRSVDKFCSTMSEYKDRYIAAMDEATNASDILTGGATALAAIGDLNNMWTELADVAPEDIQPDVEAVRDYYKEAFDKAGENATNPLAGLTGSIMGAFEVAGPTQRVNDYTIENCPDIGGPFLTEHS